MVSLFYKWLCLAAVAIMLVSFRHTSPHPVHVSVIEVEHNAAEKSLEVTCKIFTDDFEKVLAKTFKNAATATSRGAGTSSVGGNDGTIFGLNFTIKKKE